MEDGGLDLMFIAHRGNVDGIDKQRGNTEAYVLDALAQGYHTEVDVWCRENRFYLGHDGPTQEIEVDFLLQAGIWCHAKDPQTMQELIDTGVHCFFQAEDDVALTSHGFLWTHSRCGVVTPRSILTIVEFDESRIDDVWAAAGICSDHVAQYKASLEVVHG